ARLMASSAFERIGITLKWRNGLHFCFAGSVRIGVRESTPADLLPGALGYALAFEGIRGEVFLDRIRNFVQPDLVPSLFAHTLAHEITHLLEGSDTHAESGLMKRHWSDRDYDAMRRGFLDFSVADVQALRNGLDSRSTRLAAARPTKL